MSEQTTDDLLDKIYDDFDKLFRAGLFWMADENLYHASYVAKYFPIDILIGILTITLPASNELSYRRQFYNQVEEVLNERGELEPGLLKGLK